MRPTCARATFPGMKWPEPSPAELPAEPPDDVVGEVIAAFQPYAAEPIERDRGRAMSRNLGDVLMMLSDWRREDDAAAAAANPPPPSMPEPDPAPARPPVRRPKRRKVPAEIP